MTGFLNKNTLRSLKVLKQVIQTKDNLLVLNKIYTSRIAGYTFLIYYTVASSGCNENSTSQQFICSHTVQLSPCDRKNYIFSRNNL